LMEENLVFIFNPEDTSTCQKITDHGSIISNPG